MNQIEQPQQPIQIGNLNGDYLNKFSKILDQLTTTHSKIIYELDNLPLTDPNAREILDNIRTKYWTRESENYEFVRTIKEGIENIVKTGQINPANHEYGYYEGLTLVQMCDIEENLSENLPDFFDLDKLLIGFEEFRVIPYKIKLPEHDRKLVEGLSKKFQELKCSLEGSLQEIGIEYVPLSIFSSFKNFARYLHMIQF